MTAASRKNPDLSPIFVPKALPTMASLPLASSEIINSSKYKMWFNYSVANTIKLVLEHFDKVLKGEQARKFKAGENKPQLVTLKTIADPFNVSFEFLIGLKDK
jgi:hypothetical protein